MKRFLAAALLLVGCSAPNANVKVIAGAHLPSRTIEYSIVIIEGDKITQVGAQSDIPVPKGAEMTSGLDKIIEPGPGVTIEAGQPATLQLRNAKTLVIDKLMINGIWK
jgi:hypothetical protein